MIERKRAQTYVMLGITLPAVLVALILSACTLHAQNYPIDRTILPIAEPKVVVDVQPIAAAQKTEEDKSRQKAVIKKALSD